MPSNELVAFLAYLALMAFVVSVVVRACRDECDDETEEFRAPVHLSHWRRRYIRKRARRS